MEKSFLNFKAAHPDWTPADPSGSLYLSRIADFAAHPVGLGRRRFLRGGGGVVPGLSAGDMDSTVHLHPPGAGAGAGVGTGQDKYDRALRASQSVLRQRGRMGAGMAGSVLHPAQLRPAGAVGAGADSLLQSTAIAQTAVLGDSQGSVMPNTGLAPVAASVSASAIPEEDLAADGGVGSTLGESYVDGRPRARGGTGASVGAQSQAQMDEDEDAALADGGVIGLLAQIYGAGGNLNLKGRGRGPPRAL